jgi:hypothetical protein
MEKRRKAAFIGSLVLLTVTVLGSGRLSKNHGDRRVSAGEVFEGSERTCIIKRRNRHYTKVAAALRRTIAAQRGIYVVYAHFLRA